MKVQRRYNAKIKYFCQLATYCEISALWQIALLNTYLHINEILFKNFYICQWFVSEVFSPFVSKPSSFFNCQYCIKKEKQKGEEREIEIEFP